MQESPRKLNALRSPRLSVVSPLAPLLPLGFQSIQPLERGKAWHVNEKKKKTSELLSFPSIGTVDEEIQARQPTPPASVPIPKPPSDPNNQNHHSSNGSFRTRALAQKNHPSVAESILQLPSEHEKDANAMDALWHEYQTRANASKPLDKASYHRKMQQKYSELRVLKEKIAALENEVEEARRQRDEAIQEAAAAMHQPPVSVHRSSVQSTSGLRRSSTNDGTLLLDPDDTESVQDEPVAAHTRSSVRMTTMGIAVSQSPTKISKTRATINCSSPLIGRPPEPDELSYREKSLKLERALMQTKAALASTQMALACTQTTDANAIKRLHAQLALEQATNQTLSQQLVQTQAAFTQTTNQLVTTTVALEQERQTAKFAMETLKEETAKSISDEHRKISIQRLQNAVRTMGKEALHHKMTSLHARVLIAEHQMRKAQLEVMELTRQRDWQQRQSEQIWSASALKFHTLDPHVNGIPGILSTATLLTTMTKCLQGQYVRIQVLYQELREDFYLHFIAYDATTAQDDALTFRRRDLERLVRDARQYLAQYHHRKRERLLELTELILPHIQIGYKNNHLILSEKPMDPIDQSNHQAHRRVNLYRGTRFLSVFDCIDDRQLMEVTLDEVFDPAISQLWWIEVHAMDCLTQHEVTTTVSYQEVVALIPSFGSYRASDQFIYSRELVTMQEQLLEPLLAQLVVKLADAAMEIGLKATFSQQIATNQEENPADERTERPATSASLFAGYSIPCTPLEQRQIASVLDYRCIKHVDDVFYCLRIQERWDGHVMVDITMDDPESLRQFRRSVHQHELQALAKRLVVDTHYQKKYAIDHDCSDQIPNGLPMALHRPLCKVLRHYARPDAKHSSISLLPVLSDPEDDQTLQWTIRSISVGDMSVLCVERPSMEQSIDVAALVAQLPHVPPEQIQRFGRSIASFWMKEQEEPKRLMVVMDVFADLNDWSGVVVRMWDVHTATRWLWFVPDMDTYRFLEWLRSN